MQTTSTITNRTLSFSDMRTYLYAALFIAGNIAVPQLFHLVPGGGVTWLPIYFFTLVGAWCYGWRTGLLTALLSPAVNALLFGMPAVAALPAIEIKSVLLAVLAGIAATRCAKASLPVLLGVILGYQLVGTLGEWAIVGDFAAACRDFRLGLPGMLLQLFGGLAAIRLIKSRG